MLRIFTARRGADLVGYVIYLVRHSTHSSETITAMQDSIYVAPHMRGIGKALVQWSDAYLEEEGVAIVYQHVTLFKDFSPMLEASGYELIERVYGKRLGVTP